MTGEDGITAEMLKVLGVKGIAAPTLSSLPREHNLHLNSEKFYPIS